MHRTPYEIADALGVAIRFDPSIGKIRTDEVRTVDIYGLSVNFPVKIVSSAVNSRGFAVIARSLGNLGFIVVTGIDKPLDVTVALLDFAKMGAPERYLEDVHTNPHTAIKSLESAVVAVYYHLHTDKWMKVM